MFIFILFPNTCYISRYIYLGESMSHFELTLLTQFYRCVTIVLLPKVFFKITIQQKQSSFEQHLPFTHYKVSNIIFENKTMSSLMILANLQQRLTFSDTTTKIMCTSKYVTMSWNITMRKSTYEKIT